MKIEFSDFFLLRSPISPLSDFFKNSSEQVKDIQQLREQIHKYFEKPEINEGLFLSSSALFENFISWCSPDKLATQISKLDISYYKYYLRSVYRCTPFGTYAGITTGSISKLDTVLQLGNKLKRRVKLDIGYLYEVTKKITNESNVNSLLRIYSNNTIYRVANEYRYINYTFNEEEKVFSLNSIDYTPLLERTIQIALQGIKFDELVSQISDCKEDIPEVNDFINSLIEIQVLITELEPTVHGEHFQDRIANILKPIQNRFRYSQNILTAIDLTYESIDTPTVDKYLKIQSSLEELKIERESSKLFHVDILRQPLKLNINEYDLVPLKKLLEIKSAFQKESKKDIDTFRDRFFELYEDREVSLIEIMDSDSGIPYPAGVEMNDTPFFLRDLQFNNPTITNTSHVQLTFFDKLLIEKLSSKKNDSHISIKLEELNQANGNFTRNEETTNLGLILSFFNKSTLSDSNSQYEIYFKGAYSPSASNLLSRFCYIDDTLFKKVTEANGFEAAFDPDKIYAEISHLPGKRVGNIISRPSLREFEIPILTIPSDGQKIIPLNDLLISVSSNKIILRSKKFNKEVIPRLGCAHNFGANPLPIYKFLCDLQFQNKIDQVFFNWPDCLSKIQFLPRVYVDNIIVLKARWKLFKKEIESFTLVKEDQTLLEMYNNFVESSKIGRFTTFTEGDHQILIDSQNILCLRIFKELVKGKSEIVLEELLENPQNLLVHVNKEYHTNEIIIPVTIHSATSISNFTQKRELNVQRSFSIGSEWLYVKIYCGTKAADQILLMRIYPFVKTVLNDKIIISWFFLRYHDKEGHHIRLRLRVKDNLYSQAIKLLYEALHFELNKEIVKLKFDTYNRELERYGGNLILECEDFFQVDSSCVFELMNYALENDKNSRWLIGLYAINLLLDDFQITIKERCNLFKFLSEQFAIEFNLSKNINLKKAISKRYREDSTLINEFEKNFKPNELSVIMERRSINIQPIIKKIKQKVIDNSLVTEIDLLRSFIHMFLNRLLEIRQREQELLIYTYLFKHYKSLAYLSENDIEGVNNESKQKHNL
jgi:thiopeptide-type bacteriocin biosynthesis protein